jgi:hypothetical protein
MAALPVISLVAGLAGAGVSALGSYESGRAQSEAAAYQAQVARNNAVIAQQNANLGIQSGEVQASNAAMQTRSVIGATKAGEAASGVDVNSGSFVNVRASESELGALDALTLRSNAAKQAYGYEVAATSEEGQAGLYGLQSTQASQAGQIGALGTFIGGSGSVGAQYAAAQKNVPWNNPSPATSTAGSDLTYNQFGFNVT